MYNAPDMGTIKLFPKVKLITGILISRDDLKDPLVQTLTRHFGPADFTSGEFPFTFSSYYNNEMGTPISRFFLSFKNLIDPSTLAQVKISTNKIEDSFREEGKRKINIDPGIMFLSRFILASTKEGIQRIPMNAGIYGEITLVYEKKTFRPVEWTYPDYRSELYIRILNSIRGLYKEQV
jgi:hypothetical protein